MRRISLALALAGAVAATGCGGGAKPSSNAGTKGTAGINFTVTVRNVGPGTVTSAPGGISCAADTVCSATFASGTTVVLTTTVGTIPAKGTLGQPGYVAAHPATFNGFFGSCNGSTCSVTGDADQYVVAYFADGIQVHPNFSDGGVHGPAWTAYTLHCADCHGANSGQGEDYSLNKGQGLAVACGGCHGAATPAAAGETCIKCHLASGTTHQARYNAFADGINPATTKFAVSNVSLAITDSPTAGLKKATVTFTLKKGGVPFTGAPSTLKQKTVYFVTYDGATGKFPTAPYNQTADLDPTGETGGQATSVVNFSFGSMTATATPGVFTMVKDLLPADPVASATNAFLYGYFGDTVLPSLEANANPGGRHYALMDNMVSFAQVLKGAVDYTSTATVSGCERCHGAPYSKHGYRQASVAGLNDFVACKACHTDFRRGTDGGWYLLVDDRGAFAAQGGTLTLAQKTQYAYVANVMNDTHNSHAFEFAYPQSVANCTVCHEGKLNRILTDANFTATTCKSCHPVSDVGGFGGRAPALISIMPAGHATATELYANTAEACNGCHYAGGTAPAFSAIHTGYNKAIYADAAGTKWANVFKAAITGATYDSTTKELTVNFSVTGAATGGYTISNIVPQLMIAPYAFNTKDWAQSYFSQDFGGTPKTGLTLVTNGQTTGNWSVKVDLDAASTAWATQLGNGDIRRVEIGIRPWVTTTTTWAALPATAPTTPPAGVEFGGVQLALDSVTKTFDLTGVAFEPTFFGNAIVDVAKCNKCHEALGTTFHAAGGEKNRGGSVVACRMCHTVRNGGGHIEMQSRSIDSYVHALHSFQKMDIQTVNFADAVQKLEYEEHVDSIYPNFSIQNCESCHNPGTYDVPTQNQSLPSLLSKSQTLTGVTRGVSGIPAVVVGPASRACGSCHRTQLINEDVLGSLEGATNTAAADLAALEQHMADGGYRVTGTGGVDATTTQLDAITAQLKAAGILP